MGSFCCWAHMEGEDRGEGERSRVSAGVDLCQAIHRHLILPTDSLAREDTNIVVINLSLLIRAPS